MNNTISTLTIYYDTELHQKEIPLFRGAVLKSMGKNESVLYHNHTGSNTFRYSYPLIQYKQINGKAAVVCVGEGANAISEILSTPKLHYTIGHRETNMSYVKIDTESTIIECTHDAYVYKLERWLPLNSKNYTIYKQTEDFIQRIKMLNDILTANILSFLKGINIYIDEELHVTISNILKQDFVKYKGILLTALDIEFKANISLPLNIGIGKNASIGYGNIVKKELNKI